MSKPNPFRSTPFPAAGGEYTVRKGDLVAVVAEPIPPPVRPALPQGKGTRSTPDTTGSAKE